MPAREHHGVVQALHTVAVVAPLTALVETLSMASGDGANRVRDLQIVRLLRYAADILGINILRLAPRDFHQPLDLGAADDCATLFLWATAVTFLLCAPCALLAAVLSRRSARSHALIVTAASIVPIIAAASALGRKQSISAWMAAAATVLVYGIARWLQRIDLQRSVRHAAYASLSGAALILLIPTVSGSEEEARPALARAGAPNIVLISIDSLRADHLGSYGYGRNTSPNIDRLAHEGLVFENAIAPSSWTLPSHATMLTGLAPESHGVIAQNRRLSSGLTTLAERLRMNGYATAGFVSGFYLDGAFGLAQGFDVYDDYSLLHASHKRSREVVTSPTITRLATDYLSTRATQRQPFFLFLHYWDVHYDYIPPATYATMFDRDYRGTIDGSTDSPDVRAGMAKRDLDHLVALYDGEIAWTDRHIGEVLAALRRLGLDDNTIVVLTADHGEEFLEHGEKNHQNSLYDEVLHVPLIVRAPGAARGARVTTQVRLSDVAPTLLSLAGFRTATPQREGDSRSLATMVRSGGDEANAPPAFGDLQGRLASIRTADAKLIVDLRRGREELYDLSRDPRERTSLKNDPRQEELRRRLIEWRGTMRQGEKLNVTDEAKSALKSLGYLQ